MRTLSVNGARMLSCDGVNVEPTMSSWLGSAISATATDLPPPGSVVIPPGVPGTRALGTDVAEAGPLGFVAVTTTRSVPPASASATTYVAPLAPAIGAQAAPSASQRCQAKA